MSELPASRNAPSIEVVAASAGYRELIERLQRRIRESQARAARTLNTELVMLYWSIGRDILDQQRAAGWGDDIVGRFAADLRATTGSARGFSRSNVFYMRKFAAVWPDLEKVQPLAGQIGWTHHQVLLDAFSDRPHLYAWYAAKASASHWSRRHLQAQIHLGLHERAGAALTNFDVALKPADAEQALQATKDPYIFDFLELAEDASERELEQALIDDIQKFLLELKVGKFKPEYVSKMNFYLNAVDEQLRVLDDRESVGIILCASGDATVAKLALHRVYAPVAVSTWVAGAPRPELPAVEITDDVPADLDELAELDVVRTRLIERVTQRAPEIIDDAD